MKTCIIFNPAARGEKARKFRTFLESVGDGVSFKPTWAPGAATELARAAVAEGFDKIVAAGGDGTLNEVLNGIGEAEEGFRKVCLGVLPLGTINVFAKELGIPENPIEAWKTVLQGNERTVDLPYAELTVDGEHRRRYFAQLAGAGLDAEAIALVDWQAKRRYRQLAYVFAGFRALMRPQHRIEVRHGANSTTGELVLIGNGKFYGGRLRVFPAADLEDGRLDVCVFPPIGIFMALRFAYWLAVGRSGSPPPPIEHFQAERISLASATRAKFEVEGDLAGSLPVEIGIRPKALRVLGP